MSLTSEEGKDHSTINQLCGKGVMIGLITQSAASADDHTICLAFTCIKIVTSSVLIKFTNKRIKINVVCCTRSLVSEFFPQHRGRAASTTKPTTMAINASRQRKRQDNRHNHRMTSPGHELRGGAGFIGHDPSRLHIASHIHPPPITLAV